MDAFTEVSYLSLTTQLCTSSMPERSPSNYLHWCLRKKQHLFRFLSVSQSNLILPVLNADVIKIVATFYNVHYKHIKQGVMGCANTSVSNSLGLCFCQQLAIKNLS